MNFPIIKNAHHTFKHPILFLSCFHPYTKDTFPIYKNTLLALTLFSLKTAQASTPFQREKSVNML